jgi:hypothetical protein
MDFKIKGFSFIDGVGTWQVESIFIAMVIYSLFLLTLSVLWLLKYYGKAQKKVKKTRLILVYVLSPWFINIIGQVIENHLYSEELNSYIGLHLFWGETKDILITIFAPLILPIAISLLLSIFLKKHYIKPKQQKK